MEVIHARMEVWVAFLLMLKNDKGLCLCKKESQEC